MNLGNIRLANKIFAVVGLLALVAAGIAGIAALNISNLSAASDEIDLTAQEIRVSGRLGQNVVELNRAEYRLAANPADYAEVVSTISQSREELEERLGTAEATAGPEQKALLGEVRDAYRSYLAELDDTVALAQKHTSNVTIGTEQKEILASVMGSRNQARVLRDKIAAYVDFTDRKGTVISQEASASADTAMTLLVTIAVVGILAGVALGWVVANHGVVKPIRQIVACLRRLADGDLEVDVYGAQRRDEVGDIARTMQVFKDTAVEARRLEAEQEENERRAAAEKRAATLKLADDLEAGTKEVLSTLSSSSTEMEATAGSMSAIAEETSRQSQAVAAAAEQASANVQTVASAAEELSSSVNEISRQVSQSNTMAARAVEDAHRTNEQVKALAEAAERIGDVVNLITDIANQTNLLALNATIEAARAGEAGKGFAVVATEVKSLATQTARATDEIAQQIGGIQGATTDAVSAIQSIATTIGEISEIATSIAAAVEEQGLATQEIARNVAEASEGTKEVTRNISGVNTAAGETGAAATQVLATSSELSQGTTSLKGVVDEFLRTIRAA